MPPSNQAGHLVAIIRCPRVGGKVIRSPTWRSLGMVVSIFFGTSSRLCACRAVEFAMADIGRQKALDTTLATLNKRYGEGGYHEAGGGNPAGRGVDPDGQPEPGHSAGRGRHSPRAHHRGVRTGEFGQDDPVSACDRGIAADGRGSAALWMWSMRWTQAMRARSESMSRTCTYRSRTQVSRRWR